MAKLGIHKRGHGKEQILRQSVSHKKPRDLHTGPQMQSPQMTSEVHPDISSLAGPDMSGQASTQGSPYMGGMSVDSSGTTAGATGMKKGGSVSKMKKAIESHEADDISQDRSLLKKAFRMHDQQEHKGEHTDLSKLKKGGRVGYASGSKWIQSAIKKPGSLRKSLHVKSGQKIPAKKLASAAKKPGVMGRRARLAQTLRSFKK